MSPYQKVLREVRNRMSVEGVTPFYLAIVELCDQHVTLARAVKSLTEQNEQLTEALASGQRGLA